MHTSKKKVKKHLSANMLHISELNTEYGGPHHLPSVQGLCSICNVCSKPAQLELVLTDNIVGSLGKKTNLKRCC